MRGYENCNYFISLKTQNPVEPYDALPSVYSAPTLFLELRLSDYPTYHMYYVPLKLVHLHNWYLTESGS